MAFVRFFDRMIAHVVDASAWLALPLMFLLFLQWPLRDLVHGYSREANDLGQLIFALYVAVSVTAATRAGTHLATDLLAQRYSVKARKRLKKAGAVFGLLPWALFVLLSGRQIVMSSLLALESFPDTFNPGYFVIKFALWIMALMVLGQIAVDLLRPQPAEPR